MNDKLNVIFFGSFLYPNGYAATKRKQQFLDYLFENGHYARVILTIKRSSGHELNDIKGTHKGVPYEVLGANVKFNMFFPATFVIFVIKTLKSLIRYKTNSKNIVVSFGLDIYNVVPLIVAKLLGYKVVFDIVEDFSTTTKRTNIKEKINFLVLRTLPEIVQNWLASGISVISKYLYKKHLNHKNSLPVTLVPIAAENLYFRLTKNIKDSYDLLYSGTYAEKEGLPTLIDAFAKFTKDINRAKLIMTGNCPVYIVELLKNKLGDLDNVELTGRLDDSSYYQTINNADVLLMTRTNSPFANAGFPYKLGEYLATRNPVICSDVCDISLYLTNQVSAIIIPPDNSRLLYKAIRYLYANPKRAKEIGYEGYERCFKYFNPKTNSKKFCQLLQSV